MLLLSLHSTSQWVDKMPWEQPWHCSVSSCTAKQKGPRTPKKKRHDQVFDTCTSTMVECNPVEYTQRVVYDALRSWDLEILHFFHKFWVRPWHACMPLIQLRERPKLSHYTKFILIQDTRVIFWSERDGYVALRSRLTEFSQFSILHRKPSFDHEIGFIWIYYEWFRRISGEYCFGQHAAVE